MKYFKKYFTPIFLTILIGVFLMGINLNNSYSKNDQAIQEMDTQADNFNQDLNKAEDHWAHNRLGRQYSDSGDFEKAIEEYNKAIEVIQHSPGHEWPNLKKEEADRINEEAKNDTEMFPRYQLVQVYEKANKYPEALEQIDWLLAHKPLPHIKEELLNRKERIKSMSGVKEPS